MSQSIKRKNSRIAKNSPAVISASYLDRHSAKNDLISRLREVVGGLADQYVEVNMRDYTCISSLTAVLVTNCHLDHKNKEVHIYTVLACMEFLNY